MSLRLGLFGALLALPAAAQTLTMAVGAPVTSIDPHFHNIGPNNAVASMLFDTLLQQDGDLAAAGGPGGTLGAGGGW
ncbi:hypothetical protein [Dankookia sp. P2]|uniref:hypothetical protein n=1 Tax=Dankookia sp. P2 TaxID=3423955 RepID=UPI003D67F74F